MKPASIWILAFLFFVSLQLSACGPDSESIEKLEPAVVESMEGSEFKRVKLTERAARRLDIQTAAIREEVIEGKSRLVVPYAAVLYGLNGETWVYVDGDALTFFRSPISIEYIDSEIAILLDGPPPGTHVVTVGVAELYGAETGVGK